MQAYESAVSILAKDIRRAGKIAGALKYRAELGKKIKSRRGYLFAAKRYIY